MACLKSSANHPLVFLIPRLKRDPVPPEMIKALVESKITDVTPSLSDLRSVALCLIG